MALPAVSAALANSTSSIDAFSSTRGYVLSTGLKVLSTSVGDVFKSVASHVMPDQYAKGLGLVVSGVVIGGSIYMAYRDRKEAVRLLSDEEIEPKEGNKYNIRAATWTLIALKEAVDVAVSLYLPQSAHLKAEIPCDFIQSANNLSELVQATFTKPALNTTCSLRPFSDTLSETVLTTPTFVEKTNTAAQLLQGNFSDASLLSPLQENLPQVSVYTPGSLEAFEKVNITSLLRKMLPVIKDVSNSSACSNVSKYLQIDFQSLVPVPVEDAAKEASTSFFSSLWSRIVG